MQECRCPAAPDLGMGVQMPAAHTQVHQTPPRQTEARRQFLSTLAPLTSCVAGQRDDFSSYYTLAPGERASTASSQYSEYSLGDIDAVLKTTDETKKVAPDVIAGTPGQEFDELANFAQQEAVRTERLKKRYSAETSASAPNSNAGSDDDEQNDYGFNKRPSVRGIKPRFSSTNEILQQMQAQLSTPTHPQGQVTKLLMVDETSCSIWFLSLRCRHKPLRWPIKCSPTHYQKTTATCCKNQRPYNHNSPSSLSSCSTTTASTSISSKSNKYPTPLQRPSSTNRPWSTKLTSSRSQPGTSTTNISNETQQPATTKRCRSRLGTVFTATKRPRCTRTVRQLPWSNTSIGHMLAVQRVVPNLLRHFAITIRLWF